MAAQPSRGLATRDFMWTLIRTDFKVRYHGALGGFVWALAKPVVMFFVLFFVFRFLFSNHLYRWDLLVGILLWSFFSEGTAAGLESLLRKGFLLTKASFPRWIVVLTSVVNAVITLVVYALALLIVISIVRGPPRPLHLLLFCVYMLLYLAIVVGFSLGTCALFLKYRDLNQIWDVALQAGFFFAPIMYPIGTLPERYHFILYLWPVTPIIQFSRSVLLDGTTPSLTAHLLLLAMSATILGGGALIFRRYIARAMEAL
jgi:lipopolysaccharide transport system permease protein